ncbi:MAG: energy transducer TonB [Puniceicoccaceae bacterium]
MIRIPTVQLTGLIAGAIAALLGGCETTEVNRAPQIVNAPVLDYPAGAIMQLEEGVVVVRFKVMEDGTTGDFNLRQSSGSDLLDQEGLAFVRRLECEPAIVNGNPAVAWVDQSVVFDIVRNHVDPVEWSSSTIDLVHQLDDSQSDYQLGLEERLYKKCGDYMSSIITRPNLVLYHYALDLVSDSVRERWAVYGDTFPMSFLMFDDFVTRLTGSQLMDRARTQLIWALEVDIQRIDDRTVEEVDPSLQQLKKDLQAYLEVITSAT